MTGKQKPPAGATGGGNDESESGGLCLCFKYNLAESLKQRSGGES